MRKQDFYLDGISHNGLIESENFIHPGENCTINALKMFWWVVEQFYATAETSLVSSIDMIT